MKDRIEGSVVHLVLADHDTSWMMEAAQELMSHPQVKVVGFAPDGNALVDRAASMVADAVLMEYSLPDITAIEVARRLADESPGTAIFTVSGSLSAQLVQSAKANGIVEVFSKDGFVAREAADRITAHVDSLRREWGEVSKKYGILPKGTGPKGEKVKKEYVMRGLNQTVVLSYNVKGGVGKTTIAVNLAVAIKTSPYMSGLRVCLVDFDCGGANIITNCHLSDMDAVNRNIAAWEHVSENLSAKEVDELLIEGPRGVMVAAAPVNQAASGRITMDLADKILRILKRHFTVIVIDGAPNISALIDSAFEHSTHILMVANPEGQSAKQLSRTIRLLSPDPEFSEKPDMSHLIRKMFLVLNYAQPPGSWDLKKKDIPGIVGRPLISEIPYDEVVRRALHGPTKKTAVEVDPSSGFAVAIKSLANDICGAYPEGVGAQQKKKKSKKKGFFSNIFMKGGG